MLTLSRHLRHTPPQNITRYTVKFQRTSPFFRHRVLASSQPVHRSPWKKASRRRQRKAVSDTTGQKETERDPKVSASAFSERRLAVDRRGLVVRTPDHFCYEAGYKATKQSLHLSRTVRLRRRRRP